LPRDQEHRSRPKTPNTGVKVGITLGASAVALIHALLPWITIDLATAILILIAAAPWLASVVKSIELPGGFKIELPDVKAATDAVTSPSTETAVAPTSLAKAAVPEDTELASALGMIQQLSERDPNLALVSLRIEIEKRLRELGQAVGIDSERKSAARLLRELQAKDAIRPPEIAVGLSDFIALGNQAAHGAEVSRDAASWANDKAPFILALLDAQILRARQNQ
jgi:hypothetical protein